MTTINLTDKYQTRSGNKNVVIYSVSGCPPYTVHGSIDGKAEVWMPDGRYTQMGDYRDADLVPLPKEPEFQRVKVTESLRTYVIKVPQGIYLATLAPSIVGFICYEDENGNPIPGCVFEPSICKAVRLRKE